MASTVGSAGPLDFDGTDLHLICSSQPASAESVACLYFMNGLVAGLLFGYLLHQNRGDIYCPPRDGIPPSRRV